MLLWNYCTTSLTVDVDLSFVFDFPVTCGETFVASDELQTVSTPNWPENYPPNQDCYWIIKSNGGKAIEVILNPGKTEEDEDFVEVKFCRITQGIILR